MKIPLSWLKEFAEIPASVSVAEIDEAFVRVGFEVESIEVQGSDLTGPLVVALVKEIEQLEGHKKPIRYVGLDCGEGSIRYVICGATNFAVGDLVVAALPGAVLPGDFAISARETYGKTSNGMICSARELGISDEHSGIIVLPEDCAPVGTDAIALLEINDLIIDVAVNPDRGYALSARGLARELAASLNVSFKDPATLGSSGTFPIANAGVQISIDDPRAASVAYLRTIEGFNPTASTPLWMRRRIEKCGMRSISLGVDITNYVMLELGQPLHAFDKEKISGSLHIRRAGTEKKFTTLDGQERILDSDDLMVADDKNSLALAGTMGGITSEVTESTTSIALEGVRFNPTDIAKNSRRHKLSSEASRRLERSVDPLLAEISTARAVELFIELGGAKYIGTSISGAPVLPAPVNFDPSFVSSYLGFDVTSATIKDKLEIVGCEIKENSATDWTISPPSWRSDLILAPDFVEEVARMIGFDAIPSTLPIGKGGASLTPFQSRKRSTALLLANNGFTEVYNYPFVSPEMVEILGFTGDRAKSFRLANPMSEEFPLLRTHILPGLLTAAARNIGRCTKDLALFEIGSIFRDTVELPTQEALPTHQKPTPEQLKKIYDGVPSQPVQVGGVLTGNIDPAGWATKGRAADWNDAIGYAIRIIEETGNKWSIATSDFAPWHPGRCAEIQVNGKAIAHAGELHPRVCSALGLPARSVAFVVILSALDYLPPLASPAVLTMPAAVQDLALVVNENVPAIQVEAALRSGAGQLLESITLFDRYNKLGDGQVSLAYSMVFRAPDRTLTADEVTGYREAAAAAAAAHCGATVRS